MRVLIAAFLLASTVPVEAASSCVPGGLACVDASAVTSLSCTVDAVNFTCDITATYGVDATMAAPGDARAEATIEVGVCLGGGACVVTTVPATSSCAWGLGASGCATSATFTAAESGAHGGCLTVWVYETVSGHLAARDVPADLRVAHEDDETWFVWC